MTDYTPTTAEVKEFYCEGRWEAFPDVLGHEVWGKFGPEFDRWLAQRDQEAEARGAEKERARIVAEIEAKADWYDTFEPGWIDFGAEPFREAARIARGEGNV